MVTLKHFLNVGHAVMLGRLIISFDYQLRIACVAVFRGIGESKALRPTAHGGGQVANAVHLHHALFKLANAALGFENIGTFRRAIIDKKDRRIRGRKEGIFNRTKADHRADQYRHHQRQG